MRACGWPRHGAHYTFGATPSSAHNLATVASGCAIDFLAPAREGDRLTAVAQQVQVGERTGVYDIEVTASDGRRIALVRGRSHRISGRVVDDAAG